VYAKKAGIGGMPIRVRFSIRAIIVFQHPGFSWHQCGVELLPGATLPCVEGVCEDNFTDGGTVQVNARCSIHAIVV
jgi:hypothetical protein